jgi:hypothetical protein
MAAVEVLSLHGLVVQRDAGDFDNGVKRSQAATTCLAASSGLNVWRTTAPSPFDT